MSFADYLKEALKGLTYKVSFVQKGKPGTSFVQAKDAREAERKTRKPKKHITKAEVSNIQGE